MSAAPCWALAFFFWPWTSAGCVLKPVINLNRKNKGGLITKSHNFEGKKEKKRSAHHCKSQVLEYVCSLKLKSGQVERTMTQKYSIQASVLMFSVDQHTKLKCVFKGLEIEPEKKNNPMYIWVKFLLFRQTCGMCGQSTIGGFWGPLGSESRSGQKYHFF